MLHRDLKPANVMLDGRGRVRITDFGLAVAASDEAQTADMSGTPAYMAPEQLAGKGATVRSDIYALGLVLYELYTGKRAFTARTLAELRAEKEGSTPAAPSELRQGIDPIVERVIVRCLERDPRQRPASVAQLAASLPGGDPLAAAIAAGETPSPEMVAASGAESGLRPAVAFGLLAAVFAGLIGVIALSERVKVVQRIPPGKPPAVLIERAREILATAGYSTAPADSASGFFYDNEYLQDIAESDRWRSPGSLDPGVVLFWYRQSLRPIERLGFDFGPLGASDPPLQYAGDVRVVLDMEGRLRSLEAVPEQRVTTTAGQAPDWAALLAGAGLEMADWRAVEPRENPVHYADSRAAWEGQLPSGIAARIEAASYRAAPVSFSTITPWRQPSREPDTAATRPVPPAGQLFALMTLGIVIVGALFFARMNLRMGRGDRRGATRLAVVAFGLSAAGWALQEHHVATFWEVRLFLKMVSGGLFLAGLIWVVYIALEPFVRRRWPQVLVSWARLLAGDWRDPLIGRDALVGCAAGIVLFCLFSLEILLPTWLGHPETRPMTSAIVWIGPVAFVARLILNALMAGICIPLLFLFLLFFLRVVLRRAWVAGAAWILVGAALGFAQPNFVWALVPLIIIENLVFLLVIMRFGFVAMSVTGFVLQTLIDFPMTFQSSVWYSGFGYAALLAVALIALFGFRTSLGGRRLFELAE